MSRKENHTPIRIWLIGCIFFQNIVMLIIFARMNGSNLILLFIKELIRPHGFFFLGFFISIIISIVSYDNLKIFLKDFIILHKILLGIGCIIYIGNIILGLVSVRYYVGIFMIPSIFLFTYGCFIIVFDIGYVLGFILIISLKKLCKKNI